jgi:hypothetical protein
MAELAFFVQLDLSKILAKLANASHKQAWAGQKMNTNECT